MSFFKDLTEGLGIAAGLAGAVVQLGVAVTGAVATGASEVVLGKDSEVTKTVKGVSDFAWQTTNVVVEQVGVPLVTMVAKAPVSAAERVWNLGTGLADGNEEKVKNAVVGIAICAATGALLGPIVADAFDGDLDLDLDPDDVSGLEHVEVEASGMEHVDAHLVRGHMRDGHWIESYWRDGDGNTLVKSTEGYFRRG